MTCPRCKTNCTDITSCPEIPANSISFIIPIRTVSEANKTGEHWSKKHKRHRAQRAAVTYIVKPGLHDIKLPCIITFVRIAPRSLDYVNLVCCFKYIQDYVCDLILPGLKPGRADGDDRFTFEFKQMKGKPKEYAIRIEIQAV